MTTLIKLLYVAAVRVLPWNTVNQIGTFGQSLIGLVKYGDFYFPRGMQIEITTHCNRRCYYCPQSVDPAGVREIKMDVYMKWIERLKELNWKGSILFNHFNEPLLCKNLEKYVAIAKKELPHSLISIVSNGDLLTEERVLSLVSAGVFKFTITHHPPFKESWTKRMNELKKKFPSRIHAGTLDKQLLSNRGGLVAENIKQNHRISDAESLSRNGCFYTSGPLNTSIDGDYIWCSADYNKENLIGNVFSASILDSWNSEPWKSLRKKIRNAQPELDVCKGCFGQESRYATSHLYNKGSKQGTERGMSEQTEPTEPRHELSEVK
jgi:sulfatase maturation enzyme AslB (radical SAM superfamily)